jgi:hypothetical protein
MKLRLIALCLTGLACAIAWQSASGQHLLKHHHAPPACEPGFKIVEEVVMQDVERFVCKMVPETKKKWVYSMIDDPFCVQNTRHGDCPECSGPYCRKLLVKRLVDEPCPGMKCITEKIVERVPVTVYRKVPCDAPKVENIPVQPKPLPSK